MRAVGIVDTGSRSPLGDCAREAEQNTLGFDFGALLAGVFAHHLPFPTDTPLEHPLPDNAHQAGQTDTSNGGDSPKTPLSARSALLEPEAPELLGRPAHSALGRLAAGPASPRERHTNFTTPGERPRATAPAAVSPLLHAPLAEAYAAEASLTDILPSSPAITAAVGPGHPAGGLLSAPLLDGTLPAAAERANQSASMSPPAPDPAALEGESTPHAGAPASPLGRAAPEQPTALDARGAAEQSGVPSLELLHEAPQPADDFLSARHSPAILQTAPAIEPPVGLAPQSPESAAAEGPTLSEVEVPALPAQQQSLDAHAEAFEGHTSPDHFAPSQQALDRELPAELTIGAGGPIAAGEPPSVERTPAAALEANAPASSPTAGKDLHAPQKLASPGAVIRQLASAVHQSVQDGARELIVRLDPPSLGTVHLLVHQHENAVNAVIQVAAGEIRDLVTQNMSGLREALQQAGVEVGQCHVELGAGGGHRHADGDSAGRPPAHSPFRGRVERTGRGDAVTVTPYHGSLSPSLGLNYVA